MFLLLLIITFFRVIFPLKLNLNGFIVNNRNGLDKEEALSEGFPEELFGSGSKCDDSSYTGTDSSSALDEIDQVSQRKLIFCIHSTYTIIYCMHICQFVSG